ncbi:MAG: alpha-glucuronidase [Blautia sp.]|nr:alpha-glucuronidase [Blautia sp.]
MSTWKDRRVWLRALTWDISQEPDTPLETAEEELKRFMAVYQDGRPVVLETIEEMGESYRLSQEDKEYHITGGRTGILYGAYALIQALLLKKSLPEGVQAPCYPLRMLNSWDNMSGEIERGYAGRSLWFEGDAFSYDPARIRQLGRMLASVGVNVISLNNVNVHAPAQGLTDRLLPETAKLAALLRPFGIRIMLSVDFSLPLQRGLDTADPLDPRVEEWWKQLADGIWEKIPDLAGFLVKADSEHRPGPNAYGRTHAEGANMLARAVAPHGGVLVWRAFVYNCMQDWRDSSTDRPCAAYHIYHPLDGTFEENVILQVKYGPFDFQVREPLSPLFFGMPNTRLAMELQLAQEYTGQQIDIFAMPPMWRELFDDLGKERIRAVAAVSNLGRDDCWTGHPFAALNLYAFGRFGWDPDTEVDALIRDWIRLTYDFSQIEDEDALARVLQESRKTYEKYTAPLGLCWMVNPNNHYGPSPYGYEFQAWGTYNRADRNAVGIDRTGNGTGYTDQYPAPLAGKYADTDTCPEELLLYFHRLPYDYRMKDGRTLIQRIYDDHFEGCEEAERMQDILEKLPLGEDTTEVIERIHRQTDNAREWRDVINTFFHRLSGAEDEKNRKIYD